MNFDYKKTIQEQFTAAKGPVLKQLLSNISVYFDQNNNFEKFYEYVWNIETAQGFGLDIWGNIVGVTRYIKVANSNYFGFSNSGQPLGWSGFNQFNFNDGTYGTPAGNNSVYALSDQAFRLLILAKAASNISPTTAPAINSILQILFPNRGKTWVSDTGNMSMRYYFDFILEPYEISILNSGIALPRPAGVKVKLINVSNKMLGFKQEGNVINGSAQTFNNGIFYRSI